jgi:hypothetical protein
MASALRLAQDSWQYRRKATHQPTWPDWNNVLNRRGQVMEADNLSERTMREISVDEFQRALSRYGFIISGRYILDVSGRCPQGAWPVFLNATNQIDRHRTIRMAVKARTDEIARRAERALARLSQRGP